MKKIMMLMMPVLMLTGTAFGQDDAIQKFFGKYLDDSHFTVVYVSPKMFSMFSRMEWDSVSSDIRDAVHNITSLRILTTDYNPLQFYQEATHLIDLKEYETLVTIRDHGEDVKFLAREDHNEIHELLMLSGSKDEFVLMSFMGNINLDEISKLGGDMNVNGMQYLKDVKKNHK
jgi:hypothetical protein